MKVVKRVRIISSILALLLLIGAQPVMAHENAEKTGQMIPLEETTYTREEAMEILGITEEEAEKASFYVVTPETNGQSTKSGHVTIGPQQVYTFPSFTFSDMNYGSYWTCNGSLLKWAAVHHSGADVNTAITIHLYRYGQYDPNDVMDCTSFVQFLPVGETYQSGWIDAYKTDYRFVYWGGNQSKVTMIVAVY